MRDNPGSTQHRPMASLAFTGYVGQCSLEYLETDFGGMLIGPKA